MRGVRSTAAAAVMATVVLSGCGGGGGGALPMLTATPTATATATRIPTITPTEAPEVTVSGVFPAIGAAAGGIPVLVEGAGFASAGSDRVYFGTAEATSAIVLDDRRISCLAPAGAAGDSVEVSVSNGKGMDALADAFRYAGGTASLEVELSSEPEISFDDQIGTTTVVLDYLVRDTNGVPIDESNLDVTMLVNGIPLGNGGVFGESLLDRNSTELELNVHVTLVLDASYSLQQFNPPQFAFMLGSAQSLVDAGTQIWATRPGEFSSNVVWFDELISHPDPSHLGTFRIGFIPDPVPGNFTKLYGAVSSALQTSANLYGEGVAAGPRDRHVIVVFTDGQDNLSSFDNRDVQQEGRLKNGDPYPRLGWRATELQDLYAQIAAHPAYPQNLRVHTIALGVSCDQGLPGPCFDAVALERIAQVGFGQQIASAGNVGTLFEQIRREFTTLQSTGAKMALRPGDYDFQLVVGQRNQTATGQVHFAFRVNQRSAEFLGFR